jgi:hypothetical protein
MFRHITHKQVDRSQWDSLIMRAPNGLIYALSWYLDIVSPGWEALVKETNGRYVAVLPLPVQTKFGFRYLKQPLFAQQLGLFYLEKPTKVDWQQVGLILRKRFRLISQYAFNTSNSELLNPGQSALAGVAFTTYYLSLRPRYKHLLASYKANRRWRLNQAFRHNLCIEPSTDIDEMVRIFNENTAPKIHGIIGEDYEYRLLRALYAATSQRNMAHMWQAVTATGEVVAMILLFEFNGQLTYIFNCSTTTGKAVGAISALLDQVFRIYAGQDVCFDFEAPEVPNVAHFYASFGSVATPFLTITANRLPWPVRQLKAARIALYKQLHSRPAY